MSTPVTITVNQEARTLALSRSLDVGGSYLVTVELTADKTPLLSSGSAYSLTLKPQGRPSGTAYGTWPLTYVSATSATATVDLALPSLYTAIADRDDLPCILGIDEVGAGPLAYTTEQRLVRVGNQARRPEDVAKPAVGTSISAEEVTTVTAVLQDQIDNISVGALDISALTARPDAITAATIFATQEEPAEGETTTPTKSTGTRILAWLGSVFEAIGTAAGLMSTHTTTHPAPTTRDSRNEAAGTAAGLLSTHETTHPAPTTRDSRNEAAQAAASQAEAEAGTETVVRSWSPLRVWQAVTGKLLSILTTAGTVLYRSGSGLAALTLRETVRATGTADDTSLATEAATRAGLETRYRQQTPAAAAEKGGAAVAPDFTSSLTLPWTLTSNLTSFAAATNLADGETGMLLITIGAYSLPADPPAGAYKGAWTVTGTLVRVLIERIGSTYIWSADSLEVVS